MTIETSRDARRSVSIVIPVYNAEATIRKLCLRLMELYSAGFALEIVLVNDCSRDRTDAICKALHEEFPESIHYLRLAKNFGEHNAVMAGLGRARGEWCVIMDDDFQNPPEEVAVLLQKMGEGHDVVYAAYSQKNDPWFRNIGSWINNWMATKALKKPRDLYLCSFKAMNRFVVSEITKFTGPDPYIDALIVRTTNDLATAEVRHDPRRQSQSGYTFRKLFGLWSSMMIVFSIYPIRFIGAIGVVILGIGTYMMIEDSYRSFTLNEHDDPSEVESLRALLVFLRGITLFLMSIMAEYIGRIAAKFSSNPQFVVREDLPAQNGSRGNTTAGLP